MLLLSSSQQTHCKAYIVATVQVGTEIQEQLCYILTSTPVVVDGGPCEYVSHRKETFFRNLFRDRFSVVAESCVISYYGTGKGVPAGSPSRGGDVTVYVLDINQPSLPTPFYSVLVSISVTIVLSPVFHSINSPDNSPLSHSVLPVLFLPYWFFQL